jgi:nucleotide-binding universal stress UspA family protein
VAFKKILVTLDRSSLSSEVFDRALALSRGQDSQLMIFHCLNWEAQAETNSFLGIGTLGDMGLSGTYQRLRHESLQKDIEQIQNWLQNYCQQAASQGIAAQSDCRIGVPGSSICDLARSWGADLIVLGRRGHRGLSELLLGSVSNYVVHRATCAVLVVQGVHPEEIESPAAVSVRMSSQSMVD